MNIVNLPIDMVVMHLPDGSMKPVRFRVETSEGEEKVIKISGIKHTNEEKLGTKETIRKFLCLVIIDDIQRMCEINYNLNTLKWTLIKM